MTIPDITDALTRVYGDSPDALTIQARRYEHGLLAFRRRYGSGEVSVYHAPGRVNLIGEHTDYNHGYVLPMSLDKDLLLFCRPRLDGSVRLANRESDYAERSFGIAGDIPPRPLGDWANYVQGSAQWLARSQSASLLGMDSWADGSPPYGVPRGSGLSSSSALTVAAMVALAHRNRIALQGAELATACSQAEWYVGTRGGIMDHFASVLGQRDHALFLDCRPGRDGAYSYRHVPIPAGYAVMVVDSRVRHRNTGPEFNRRVAEGRIGVRLLQRELPGITHLRDVEDVPWEQLEPLLPEVIDSATLLGQGIDPEAILDGGVSPQTRTFRVRRRCRHVVTENRRVLQSRQALEMGDMARFGWLMREAHASARDDYEISTPEIEALVDAADSLPGTLGARLTGAGWGGCIVAIVHADSVADFGQSIRAVYKSRTGLDAGVFTCRSAAGAGLVLTTQV